MVKTGEVSYKNTIRACYIGNISMAAISNFLPLVFITLRNEFGLSYSQLGAITLINFVTQVMVDFAFGALVDKYGFRRFILLSTVLTVIGFSLFSAAPLLSDRPYPIFILATVIFSGSCGLLELLLSPIVNSVPTQEKTKAMSVLHAFYCWGVIIVVLVSTVLLRVLGYDKWRYVMLMWTVVPIVDFFFFLKVPLAPPIPQGQRQSFKRLPDKKLYALLCLAILCGAAAELTIGQWASAFMEKALGVSKLVGDTAGVCMFALMMGLGRTVLGKKGESVNINKVLLVSFIVAFVGYLTVFFSGNSIVTLVACAVTGLAVSAMWPGALVSATKSFPFAGAWMFAVLSGFGDAGGALAPWLAGNVMDAVERRQMLSSAVSAQSGMKYGLLFGAVFPAIGIVIMLLVIRTVKRTRSKEQSEQAS